MIRLRQCARITLVLVATFTLLSPQTRRTTPAERRLPSGTLQREAILKMEYEKTLKDAEQLLELAAELKIALEKNNRYVLSISSLRKAEEIEKLAKRIRRRLRK